MLQDHISPHTRDHIAHALGPFPPDPLPPGMEWVYADDGSHVFNDSGEFVYTPIT